MFKSIKKIINDIKSIEQLKQDLITANDKIKLLNETVDSSNTLIQSLEKNSINNDKTIAELQEKKCDKDKVREEYNSLTQNLMDSQEPWFELSSFGFKNGEVELKMDWNKSFIEMMRKSGRVFNTDEEAVYQFLQGINLGDNNG